MGVRIELSLSLALPLPLLLAQTADPSSNIQPGLREPASQEGRNTASLADLR